jgi:C4-dicarboxylate transporter, DctM subunit
MEWTTALYIIVGIIVVLIWTGLPVAMVLLSAAFGVLLIDAGPSQTMFIVAQEADNFWSSWTIMAVPLFVLMGEFLYVCGSATDVYNMVSMWFRRFRGGLALVSTGACAIFASMCGSSAAGTATMAVITIPEMLRRGYSQRLATGCIAAAGALAHIIPPSMLIVVYASLVEASPGRCLMAAVIPGLILAFFYATICFVWATVSPESAPKEPKSTWTEKIDALKPAWQPVIVIMAIMGTMYTGIATATEAAAMGAIAALFILLVKLKSKAKNPILKALKESARVSCFIMVIATAGKMLGAAMAYYQIPSSLVNLMMEHDLNRIGVMVAIQLVYVLLGMFIDPVGIMVVSLPVVLPILNAYDFNVYWFCVMAMVNFEIALVTPPMGTQLYIIKGIVPEVPLGNILQGALIFMIGPVCMLVLLYVWPELATWLPTHMIAG